MSQRESHLHQKRLLPRVFLLECFAVPPSSTSPPATAAAIPAAGGGSCHAGEKASCFRLDAFGQRRSNTTTTGGSDCCVPLVSVSGHSMDSNTRWVSQRSPSQCEPAKRWAGGTQAGLVEREIDVPSVPKTKKLDGTVRRARSSRVESIARQRQITAVVGSEQTTVGAKAP